MKSFLLIAAILLTSCGQPPQDPNALAQATATAAPTPIPQTTSVPNPEATAIPEPENAPSDQLWQDPLTETYWFIGGLGNVDKALNICYGDYRIPTYFELYRASIDGLAKFDPKITQIWSLDSAYFDPLDNKAKVYYVDLLTSTMVAGNGDDVKGLACIWDPK